MELNVNNLSIDSNGRVSFSGLNSGIDFQKVVDSIIAARRVPVDLLETEVAQNNDKVAALGDLKTLLSTVKDSLSKLRGAVSVGNTNNIFETKEAFASTSRIDGGSASSAANLIGVTVSNAASVGSHSFEVLQTAKAHKIASDAISSTSATLGFSTGDTIEIEGVTITLNPNDDLLDLRDRINNANKGTNATGVSASIVTVSATEHYLVLTKDESGSDISISETSGTPLQDIGIFDAGSNLKNQLQASRMAQIYADGLLDQTNTLYESALQSASTVTASTGGTLTFTRDSDSAPLGSIVYTNGDDLDALAASITASITDVTATVVTDGNGVRLEITGANGFSITDTGSAVSDFGIDNKRRLIERTSNTIDDLFTGVTLSLFQAEQGTTIDLEIERDLNSIKTQIGEFVDAYNELRRFINDQRTLVETDEDDEASTLTGVLYGSQALERADTALSSIIAAGISGVDVNYSVLAQIGIDFIPLGSETDPLDANTLEVDESALDEALLNQIDNVKRLFSFDFTTSDPRVTLLGFSGTTEYNASGYTINVQPADGDNMFEYSEAFDNAYWSISGTDTISADVATAPTGDTTADGLIADAVNSTHYITNGTAVPVTAGESYTLSIYAKQGANDETRINLAGPQFPSSSYARFDLTNGTLVDQGLGIDAYSVEDAGDGWYRISITATAAGTGNAWGEFYSMPTGSTAYTGDGATVDTYFFGAQLNDAAIDVNQIDNLSTIRATSQTSAGQADPYGNFNATEIIADTNNSDHSILNADAISVTSGETYDFVAYLQQGDRSQARMTLNGAGFSSNSYVEVDLNAGTVLGTGSGADSASIESVGGGWYRVTLTATAIADDVATTEIRPRDAATGLTFTGDGATANTYVYDMKLIQRGAEVPNAYAVTAGFSTATANVDGTSDGADDGTATFSNNALEVIDGDAKGLRLYIDGIDHNTSFNVDFTIGAAAQMFFAIDELLDEETGLVETEISSLTDTTDSQEDRIAEMLERIEIQRRSLLERFIAMETALATSQRILDSIARTTDAMFQSRN